MVLSLDGGYRSLLNLISVMGLQRIKERVALSHVTIIGTASTYNPYRGGSDAKTITTASGDPYDPAAWTAAIQIDLREQFGWTSACVTLRAHSGSP